MSNFHSLDDDDDDDDDNNNNNNNNNALHCQTFAGIPFVCR